MKYKAKLVRLRFEVAEVDVDVANDDGVSAHGNASHKVAELLAKRAADRLPDCQWEDQTSLYSDRYDPWVAWLISEHDVDADGGESLDEYAKDEQPLEDLSYLLLEADLFSGEGRLIMQPWFNADNQGLLEADVIGDWIAELRNLRNKPFLR